MDVVYEDDEIMGQAHDSRQEMDDIVEILHKFKTEYENVDVSAKGAVSDEVMEIVNEHVFVNDDGTLSIIVDPDPEPCVYGPPGWYEPNDVIDIDEPDVYGPLPSIIDVDE